MIKASQSAESTADNPESSALQCWGRTAQTEGLRVELANHDCFVFPYGQLVYAELSGKQSQQTIKIGFASHAVKIEGSDLMEVLKALQKLSVEWVKETPARYAPLVAKGAAKITSIVIEDLEDTHQAG